MQRHQGNTRLNALFSSLTQFHTDKKEIHIQFDNGIDPNPTFSGPVKGKLSIEQDALILTINEKRKEILFSPVQKMEWDFLALTDEKFIDPKAKTINAKTQWRTTWPKEKGAFPSVIRLHLTQKGEKTSFAYFLPTPEPLVTYL